jgi:prepilin-type N-terminal cleavage/methylation domain-containing protein
LSQLKEAGFTFVELLVTMAIAATVMGICVAWVPPMTEVMQADADLQVLKSQISLARDAAMNHRRSVELEFIPPNVLQVTRQNLPNGTTVLARVVLEHGTIYTKFSDSPDTPDGFGANGEINLSGAGRVFFTAEGTLTDVNGNPVNASVFIGQPGKRLTARSVTIFGPTARVRGYRWNGAAWRN